MADQESKAVSGLSRRALLRNGLVTCFGAAVVSIASPAFSGTARAASRPTSRFATSDRISSGAIPEITVKSQPGWAWCSKCQGSFYAGNSTRGQCPAGGSHGASPSDNYIMYYDPSGTESDTQPNWNWCRKCQGMFYGPQQSKVSARQADTITAPAAIIT